MPPKRSLSPSPNLSHIQPPTQTFSSAPITDRASTFTAIFSPTIAAKTLQSRPEFISATHRIAAWRIRGDQQTLTSTFADAATRNSRGDRTLTTGFADDGEKYGGRTLLKVLEAMDVVGAVVVARWYGGVMLGPARFEHMKECAREAVGLYLLQRDSDTHEGPIGKKVRADDRDDRDGGEEETRKLREELAERDRSITVLRGFLGEKKSELALTLAQGSHQGLSDGEGRKGASGIQEQSSPTKPVLRYDSMGLAELRRAEKARDATISFILKALEKVEAELEAKKKEVVGQKATIESSDLERRGKADSEGQETASTKALPG